MITSLKLLYDYLCLTTYSGECNKQINTTFFDSIPSIIPTNNIDGMMKLNVPYEVDSPEYFNITLQNYTYENISYTLPIYTDTTTINLAKPLRDSIINDLYISCSNRKDYIIPCQYISFQDVIVVNNYNDNIYLIEPHELYNIESIKLVTSLIYHMYNIDNKVSVANEYDKCLTMSAFLFNSFTLTNNLIFNLFSMTKGIGSSIQDNATIDNHPMDITLFKNKNIYDVVDSTVTDISWDLIATELNCTNNIYYTIYGTDITNVDTVKFFNNGVNMNIWFESYKIEKQVMPPHVYISDDIL